MFNMFVVALVPFKLHCYFLKFIYRVKNIGQVSPSASKRTYLTCFSKPWYRVRRTWRTSRDWSSSVFFMCWRYREWGV